MLSIQHISHHPKHYVPLSGLEDVPRKHPTVPTKFDADIAFEKGLNNASPYNKPHHRYGRYHDKLEKREFMSKEAISKRAKQLAKKIAIGVGIGLSGAGLGVGVGSLVTSQVQGASIDKKLQDLQIRTKEFEDMRKSWNPTTYEAPKLPPPIIHDVPKPAKNKHVTFDDEDIDRYLRKKFDW